MNARCTLVWPSREYLPGYVDALERGSFSSSTSSSRHGSAVFLRFGIEFLCGQACDRWNPGAPLKRCPTCAAIRHSPFAIHAIRRSSFVVRH